MMNACTHMVSLDTGMFDGLLPLAYAAVFALITAKAMLDRRAKSQPVKALAAAVLPAGFAPKEAVSWT